MDFAQQQALLSLALHAAYADGSASNTERESVMKMAQRFQQEGVALPSADPETRARTVRELASQLRGPESGQLAYEMAASVCEADKSHSAEEKAFLADLRIELGLEEGVSEDIHRQTAALAAAHAIPAAPTPAGEPKPFIALSNPPVPSTAKEDEMEKIILNSSILAGALELLPSSLATMAIIPVQMRLVYRIGKMHGYDLDHGHIKDLLATLGVGLTSQVVEGFFQRVVGGLLGSVAGGLGRSLGGQAASSGMSFATTYALGHLARQYYAGGRRFSAIELRGLYDTLMGQGRALQTNYGTQIREQAGRLDLTSLPALLCRN